MSASGQVIVSPPMWGPRERATTKRMQVPNSGDGHIYGIFIYYMCESPKYKSNPIQSNMFKSGKVLLMAGVKVNKKYDLVQSFATRGTSDLSPKS